jgi:H+/Cl- antiporter ClcA
MSKPDFYRYKRRIKSSLGHRDDWRIRLTFWGGALIVGIVIAYFASLSEAASHIFFSIYERYWWSPLILTPIGFVLLSVLMRLTGGEIRGSGIPQVILALNKTNDEFSQKMLSVPIAVGKVFLTCGGLLFGASIGREGPSVHVGAALMYQFGRLTKIKSMHMHSALILAGGSAGIAAAFNAPLAGVVFAIEELAQAYEQRNSGTLIIAIIISGIAVISISGNYTYFGITDESISVLENWLPVACVAITGGVAGGLFAYILVKLGMHTGKVSRRHPFYWAAAMGIIVAVIGVVSGGATFGSGYSQAGEFLDVHAKTSSIEFPILKSLATLFSYLSGIPGGLFSPSLASGAGFGAWIAQFFDKVQVAPLALLGMTAYLSGVVQRPITSFVIVIELTGNQSMLLPVMICAVVGSGLSKIISPKPVYHGLAEAIVLNYKEKQEEKIDSKMEETGSQKV